MVKNILRFVQRIKEKIDLVFQLPDTVPKLNR